MHHFQKHYTREEARALLPKVKQWLEAISLIRRELESLDKKLSSLVEPGRDLGGTLVNRWAHCLGQMRALIAEFDSREIQLKDLDRGLVDFPAIIGGKEVFLCWEQGEADIEFWHDLDAGYAGRAKL